MVRQIKTNWQTNLLVTMTTFTFLFVVIAQISAQTALQADPYSEKGRMLYKEGRYQKALRLNPNNPTPRQNLAEAQTTMKEEKAAQEAAWANLADSMKNNSSTQPAPPRRNEDIADEETAAPRRGKAQNETGRNRTSPEGAPTEEEVKQAIEKFTQEFYDAYNGSKAFISSWDSPIQILPGREDMDNTDPNGDHMMYPVKVDFTITIEGKRSIKYTGGALGFHKNAFGEWKYYTLEDYQKK